MGDRPPWTNRRSPDPATSPTLQQMFALARRMGYEMRPIAKQPDAQRQSQGNRLFPDQNRGFRSQAQTGRDYSRIKCFSWPAARDRTLPFPSNLQVGTFNLIIASNAMETTTRETLHRPGPHPHRSIRTSFDPHVIFMHHIDFNFSYAGHYDHTYSSTSEFMCRNMHVKRGSGSCGITGGVFTRR